MFVHMPATKKSSKVNGTSHPHPSAPHVTVVRVPMGRLTPHPDNARRGNVDHIARSLQEFGQYKPLVVQESTGHILCGNHTYAAAQSLGYTHIDVHYQDIPDDKALRLALADNGTGDLATWDISLLAKQLKEAGDNVRDGSTAEWIGDHSQSTVWKIARDKTADGGHATQKPLECMERPIRNHDGDVYEPFCGSGTTLIAAERQGRISYSIELLPACCGIILQRLKDFGLVPELEGT